MKLKALLQQTTKETLEKYRSINPLFKEVIEEIIKQIEIYGVNNATIQLDQLSTFKFYDKKVIEALLKIFKDEDLECHDLGLNTLYVSW